MDVSGLAVPLSAIMSWCEKAKTPFENVAEKMHLLGGKYQELLEGITE
jgi:hypothetical protein